MIHSPRRHRRCPLILIAGIAIAGAPLSAEEQGDHDAPPAAEIIEHVDFQAVIPRPQVQLLPEQVLYALEGFVLHARQHDWLISGNALRWDQSNEELYASGDVVMLLGQSGFALEARDPLQEPLRRLEASGQADETTLSSIQGLIEGRQRQAEQQRRNQPLAGESLRIHAHSLGLRRLPGPYDEQGRPLDEDGQLRGRLPYSGRAEQVTVWVSLPENRLARISAEQMEIHPDRFILRGLDMDAGYGALLSFQASSLVIGLRPAPAIDREGFVREIEDVTLWGPQLQVLRIPVFWLPLLYRDFRIDYPWTRYEAGTSRRLGRYLRSWIGTDLPAIPLGYVNVPELAATEDKDPEALEMAWRREPMLLEMRAEGRYDYYSKAGRGLGGRLSWTHPLLGSGRGLTYVMPQERVYLPFLAWERAWSDGPLTLGRLIGSQWYAGFDRQDKPPPIVERHAKVVDVEHFWSFGSLSAYGRYLEIPDADPRAPDVLDPLDLFLPSEYRAPNERFRSDFLSESLEQDPPARQGGALAYSTPLLSAVVDVERAHHPFLNETERELGVQITAPPLQLLGPLHLDVSAWAERLRREGTPQRVVGGRWSSSKGQRHTYDSALDMSQWIGGLGLDLRLGVQGQWERHAQISQWQRSANISPFDAAFGGRYDSRSYLLLDLRDFGSARQLGVTEVDSQYRWQPYASGGISLRLQADWDAEEVHYRHILTPRLGFEVRRPIRGTPDDEWVNLGFGGERSSLPQQRQLLVLGVNSSLVRDRRRTLLSLDLTTRWSWREVDRRRSRSLSEDEQRYLALLDEQLSDLRQDMRQPANEISADWGQPARGLFLNRYNAEYVNPFLAALRPDDLAEERASSPLVEVEGRIAVNPSPTFSLAGNARYNVVDRAFTQLAGRASWLPHRRVQMTWQTLWLPERVRPVDDAQLVDNILLRAAIPDIDQRLEQSPWLADSLPPGFLADSLVLEEDWQHQASLRLIGNRYELRSAATLRSGGNILDAVSLTLSRSFVDGQAGLQFEYLWDERGRGSERRIGFTLSLYGFDVYR